MCYLQTISLFEQHPGKVLIGQGLSLHVQACVSRSSVHSICHCGVWYRNGPVLRFGIWSTLPVQRAWQQRDLSASFSPSEKKLEMFTKTELMFSVIQDCEKKIGKLKDVKYSLCHDVRAEQFGRGTFNWVFCF